MLVVAWVLLVCFGFVSLTYWRKFIFSSVNGMANILTFFFSMIVSAVSAGVIWGGLFQ